MTFAFNCFTVIFPSLIKAIKMSKGTPNKFVAVTVSTVTISDKINDYITVRKHKNLIDRIKFFNIEGYHVLFAEANPNFEYRELIKQYLSKLLECEFVDYLDIEYKVCTLTEIISSVNRTFLGYSSDNINVTEGFYRRM